MNSNILPPPMGSSRADWVLQPWLATSLGEGKL